MAAHRRRARISPDTPSFIAACLVAVIGVLLIVVASCNYAASGSISFHPTPSVVSAPLLGSGTATHVMIGEVSDGMAQALSDAGYDDATVPVPIDLAVSVCVTDADCEAATLDTSI